MRDEQANPDPEASLNRHDRVEGADPPRVKRVHSRVVPARQPSVAGVPNSARAARDQRRFANPDVGNQQSLPGARESKEEGGRALMPGSSNERRLRRMRSRANRPGWWLAPGISPWVVSPRGRVFAAAVVLSAQLGIALPFLLISPATLRGVPGPLLVLSGVAAAFVLGPWEGAALTAVAVLLAVAIIGENRLAEPLVWLPVAVGVGMVGERVRRGDELRRSLLDALRQGLVSLVQDPKMGPVVIVSRYVPAEAAQMLAGDFYGEIQQPSGQVAVMVGDVAGHGPSAAAIATRLRASWRGLASAEVSAPETIRILNEMLIAEHNRHSTPVTFATLCLVSFDAQLATASVLLAGHPPPILVAPGVARECVVAPHPPIGVLGSSEWHSHEVELPNPPWTLILYTDGLVEGRSSPAGPRPLGTDRLIEILSSYPAPITEADADAILARVEQVNGGALPDDVVFLAVSPQVAAGLPADACSDVELSRG